MSDDTSIVESPRARYQHKSYLNKPGYRKLDIVKTIAAGEDEATKRMAVARWGETWETKQTCPYCGAIAAHYKCKSRWRWTCREKKCTQQFTVLSKTRLHGAKMSALTLLSILHHFVEAKDSMSARELSGLHDLNYQTMHVLLLKIREALADSMRAEPPLTGFIQADAAYFIKYVRPGNIGTGAAAAAKQDQKNAGVNETGKVAKKRTISPNMHVLMVFVQMGLQGDRRYKVAKLKTENEVDMRALAPSFCTPDSVMVTDQADAYMHFIWQFEEHKRVNHSAHFVTHDGTHTNLAEGFFSRMRTAHAGAWHRVSIQHLELYGWEIAWRQTMVGSPNDVQLHDLLKRLLQSGRPSRFIDYWSKRAPHDRPDPDDVGGAVEVPVSDIPKKMGRPKKGSLPVATREQIAAHFGAPADPAEQRRTA